ncbi:unnamed protein product [Umbelopsis vinacea]
MLDLTSITEALTLEDDKQQWQDIFPQMKWYDAKSAECPRYLVYPVSLRNVTTPEVLRHIKHIDAILRKFFWQQRQSAIAWHTICQRKMKGELGVIPVTLQAKALMLHHLVPLYVRDHPNPSSVSFNLENASIGPQSFSDLPLAFALAPSQALSQRILLTPVGHYLQGWPPNRHNLRLAYGSYGPADNCRLLLQIALTKLRITWLSELSLPVDWQAAALDTDDLEQQLTPPLQLPELASKACFGAINIAEATTRDNPVTEREQEKEEDEWYFHTLTPNFYPNFITSEKPVKARLTDMAKYKKGYVTKINWYDVEDESKVIITVHKESKIECHDPEGGPPLYYFFSQT